MNRIITIITESSIPEINREIRKMIQRGWVVSGDSVMKKLRKKSLRGDDINNKEEYVYEQIMIRHINI